MSPLDGVPAPTERFDAMTLRDDWEGFGYLGLRHSAGSPELLAQADAWVGARADAAGWSDEALFTWANSKRGRWTADLLFGGDGRLEQRQAQVLRDRYLP